MPRSSRFASSSPARLATLAAALPLALALGAGCVTRTVYVVDDDPPAQSVPPPSRGDVAAPSGGGGGMYAVEDEAGIRDESDFYEPLAPYGRWVMYPSYGRVWVPHTHVVGAGYRPYTHGHWENTEWGWTWVDHHPFGWATGHYGRWFYDSSYGWVWVPGRTWAPAWVTWRSGGSYVGWAPMPPGAAFGGVYTVYDTSWVFVSYSSFGYGYVGSHLIVGPAYRTCFVSTSPYRETYVVYGRTYYRGPSEDEVVRGGGRVVHRPVRDVERERPVTRPPEGTALARNRERSRDRDRDDDGTSGSARGRDDATSGSSRDRDGTRSDGTDDRGDSRDGDDARADGRDDGRDDVRGPDDARGRGDGRNDPSDDARGRDDVRIDDPRGRADIYRGETDGRVVEPRPIVVGDDVGNSGAPDARPDPRGERGSRVDVRPDVGGAHNDARSPYVDMDRPTKQYPENPDRVRDLGRPDPTPSTRVPTGPTPYDRGPAPSPSYDRGPAPSYDRGPARSGHPVGPSIDRGPAPSRSPSMGSPAPSRSPSGPAVAPAPTSQPQSQGDAKKKSDGKKSSKKSSKAKGK